MTYDVAVVGSPFLDLTFEGLPHLPRVKEEVVARTLHVAPGGTGMQALASARLGLTTALVAPIGRTGAASLVRAAIEREGVRIVDRGPEVPGPAPEMQVPTTALLTTSEGVAMATVLDGSEPSPADVATVEARAAVVSLGRLGLAPPRAAVYAVTGALEVGHVDDATIARLSSARALVLNAAEALALTGCADPEAAARNLARRVTIAVVTTGAGGALAAQNEGVTRAHTPEVDVVDATGAGDLFVAAYVWADLHGAPLADRLAWASLYAGLSVRAPTAYAGALKLEELLAEGRSRGLAEPPALESVSPL